MTIESILLFQTDQPLAVNQGRHDRLTFSRRQTRQIKPSADKAIGR
jgi:hypothetical protein